MFTTIKNLIALPAKVKQLENEIARLSNTVEVLETLVVDRSDKLDTLEEELEVVQAEVDEVGKEQVDYEELAKYLDYAAIDIDYDEVEIDYQDLAEELDTAEFTKAILQECLDNV